MEKIIATEILPSGIDNNLYNFLEELNLTDSILYYGFPIFKDYEEISIKSKFAILSPEYGLILIYSTDKYSISVDDDKLEQLYSFVEASFKKSKILRKNKKDLNIPINCYLYLNEKIDEIYLENEVLTSLQCLKEVFENNKIDELSKDIISEARSIIEGSKVLSKTTKKTKVNESPSSKSNILIELEKEISNFDEEQRKIAINLINGPQRIRGLAGSGKTIVLAMKVANIHLQYPNKKILFTFYTKSLYGMIEELIKKFYWHYTGAEPNWDNIDILHAWGGVSIEGVAYNVSLDNDIRILSFKEAQKLNSNDAFRVVCTKLLEKNIKPKYDYILIDEAQDLPNEFFKICFYLAKGKSGKEKNIVWAYDELQSIFQVYQRTPEELFGNDSENNPNVDLKKFRSELHHSQKNDLVLYKCYRNPLEVLLVAHALGFGLYSDKHVQKLENAEHWRDVGYTVDDTQDFSIGKKVVVKREHKNSPLSIYKYQSPNDLIKTYEASNITDECIWVLNEILLAISEGLNAHDILVIGLDDRYANKYFSKLSELLSENGIYSNNLLASMVAAPAFTILDRVTLSTVHRAKGNEASLVFAVGIDAIYTQKNTIRGRNKIFTAFTRTKAWLRVSGVSKYAKIFFDEIEKSLTNSPKLEFIVQEITSLQRDFDSNPEEMEKLYSAVEELKGKGYTQQQLKLILEEKLYEKE